MIVLTPNDLCTIVRSIPVHLFPVSLSGFREQKQPRHLQKEYHAVNKTDGTQIRTRMKGSVPMLKKYFDSTPNSKEHSGAGTKAGISNVNMEARNLTNHINSGGQLIGNLIK